MYLGDYFGDLVAIKKQTRDGEKLENYLFRELAVLKSAHHPNLMAYFGACNEVNPGGDSHALYIVTEFWCDTCVRSFIHTYIHTYIAKRFIYDTFCSVLPMQPKR